MPTLSGYQLYSIETGRFGLDGGAMFGIVPKPLWEKKISADKRNRIPLHMRCLLMEGHGRLILIDNGLGDKYDDKFKHIFAVDHEWATLDRSLAQHGFHRDEVTDVILTHLHFDHCGGSTQRSADQLVVAFPHARFHVQKHHWDWALASNVREKASFLRENLEPLAASGQVLEVEGTSLDLPHCEAYVVNGHTEAQQVILIGDESERLAFVADLLPTTAHLAPAWNMAYDLRPMQTIAEKADFLKRALTNGWQLFFEHDPFVEVASLTQTERGIQTTAHRPLTEF